MSNNSHSWASLEIELVKLTEKRCPYGNSLFEITCKVVQECFTRWKEISPGKAPEWEIVKEEATQICDRILRRWQMPNLISKKEKYDRDFEIAIYHISRHAVEKLARRDSTLAEMANAYYLEGEIHRCSESLWTQSSQGFLREIKQLCSIYPDACHQCLQFANRIT